MDALGWDERYRTADRLWSAGPNLFVEDRLKNHPPGRGLDLAGGEGRNAVWLVKRGWSMSLVDFSEEAISRASAHSDEVELILADVLEWEPEGRFDLVLVAYLHLEPASFESVIRRSRDWLEPKGELFLIGHDLSNLEDGYGGPQYPELLWDLERIVGWVEGLEVIEASVVRRPVATEDGTEFARDTLVRARRID